MIRARLQFRDLGWATLSFCLAWTGLTACGSTDGDLFDDGAQVRGDAGDSAGGNADSSGGRTTGGAPAKGGAQTGGAATGGAPMQPASGGVGASGAGGAEPCEFRGEVYQPGQSFENDCNRCWCVSGNELSCTAVACHPPQGGAGGGPGAETCENIVRNVNEELEAIQSCEADEECGQVLEGTSCGCTRNLVARKDADISRFEELNRQRNELCEGLLSTCDCPAADGFKCASNRCTWNYQSQSSCEPAEPGQLCLKRNDGEPRASLEVGQKLSIEVQPKGCFSSSCTKVEVASCSLEEKGGNFVASAEFCMADTSVEGGGCTADCGLGMQADCQSEITLTKGKHTVTLGELSLSFEVPGVIPEDALCVGARF